MPTAVDFNAAALERAKEELHPFQSNVMIETPDGSQLRAVWEGHRFVDYALGDPVESVKDFWIERRFENCSLGYERRSYNVRPYNVSDLGRHLRGLPRHL